MQLKDLNTKQHSFTDLSNLTDLGYGLEFDDIETDLETVVRGYYTSEPSHLLEDDYIV